MSTLAEAVHRVIGSPNEIGVAAFDGSTAQGDAAVATIVIRRPEALARIATAPGDLGLTRAYVSGDLEVEGDLFAVLDRGFRRDVPKIVGVRLPVVVAKAAPWVWREVLRPPPRPPEEITLSGRLHSVRRDRAAISHHYDVSNEFYEIVLGPSMTYSCAYFARHDDSLEQAQAAKHELVCTKLGLEPGQRLLDVGCGWGELAIHAAREHGVQVVGVTISRAQEELARKRVAEAGLLDMVDIRLQDYRHVDDGPFDAISSIGMFEHVGRSQIDAYARHLYDLLAGGGRLLNHAISSAPVKGDMPRPRPAAIALRRLASALGSSYPTRARTALIQRYVFPDGELHDVGQSATTLEAVGFEVRHVENLREHYALTLRNWVQNLHDGWDAAVAAAGEGRARVWKLYMSASAIAFERRRIAVHQTLAVKPARGGDARMPLRSDFRVGPR